MKFKSHDHLGARSYFVSNDEPYLSDPKIPTFLSKRHVIDPTAVLGVLMKNYVISDRTLAQGIRRKPWMAGEDGSQSFNPSLPFHGKVMMAPEEIAVEMKERLRSEALRFLEGKEKVGILLSGGMDSRVVAGVVRSLQESGLYTGKVTALTWGLEESRDVIYAEHIARQFGWEFLHFPLNSEVLRKNIFIAADRGAEYSPVHLHAMSAIAELGELDGVLAGSYGDSIGRGEYSGKKVDKLPHILDKHLNHFGFMRRSVEKEGLEIIKADLSRDRNRFPGRSEMAYREIEMQMHYMRRQLNSCMEIIDDRVPLYQMFSDPQVFGFMWSLDPACRTDENYECLLKILPGSLLGIPWARTGKIYNKPGSKPLDNSPSLNNHYGKWLRTELRDFVVGEVSSGALQSLGVFNEKALAMWLRYWSKTEKPKADRLDEKMAWLASLSIFVKQYEIQGIDSRSKISVADHFSQMKALLHYQAYYAATRLLKR